MRIFKRIQTKVHRRQLRKDQTIVEDILWFHLRNKAMGIRCRRQHGIGPYIVDFYFPKAKLVVELDGVQHIENKEYDNQRNEYLESLGIQTLRFMNSDIHESIEGTLDQIYFCIHKPSP